MDSPVAIVGIGCRFAGCPSPGALWNAVMSRRNMLSVPGEKENGLFLFPFSYDIMENK